MYKLLRFYNQNRFKIWIAIVVIIFVVALTRILNYSIKEQDEKIENNNEVSKNYKEQSKTITSDGGSVEASYQNTYGKTIDKFYKYCIDGEIEKAYDMLSKDMKNLKYPNMEIFKQQYFDSRFQGDMQYSFQSWSTGNNKNIYIVNIYENILATGKPKEENYIEEYITIVPEEDTYKVNIDGYIGRENINKKVQSELINIEVAYVDQYIDYEIYTFKVKNNTDKTILMDTRKNTKNTYIVDQNFNKYDALIYENTEESLKLKSQESKEVKIKFSDVYRASLKIKEINFNDIVDYEQYEVNKEVESEQIKIEL